MRDDTRNRREHEQNRGQRERVLVRTSPDSRTGMEHQQTNRLAAAVQCHHEQPGAPILACLGITHHRAAAVIDLRLLGRRGDDHHPGFGRLRPHVACARIAARSPRCWRSCARGTKPCQMARALRPRLSPNSMASRGAVQALARGLDCGDTACPRPDSVGIAPTSPGWDRSRTVITSG
jgi:hypothetical protein